MGSERRRYERRELNAEVYCYLEGQRVDVNSTDVSVGGMFIETEQPILPGTELAVVMKAQLLSGERPVFLAARVMRRQTRPVPGVGVRWENATTPGSVEVLREFLRSMFGIEARRVEERPHGGAGLVQAVYIFPLGLEDFEDAPSLEETPPLFGGGDDIFEGVDDDEETIPELAEDVQDAIDEQRRGEAGPLTQELSVGSSQAPTDLKAIMAVEQNEHPVRITTLGTEHAFVTTNTDLTPGARLDLRFGITARGGIAEVRVRAEVLSTGRDQRSGRRGVRMKFTRIDEGQYRGILRQYTRWLHFNSIRDSRA